MYRLGVLFDLLYGKEKKYPILNEPNGSCLLECVCSGCKFYNLDTEWCKFHKCQTRTYSMCGNGKAIENNNRPFSMF